MTFYNIVELVKTKLYHGYCSVFKLMFWICSQGSSKHSQHNNKWISVSTLDLWVWYLGDEDPHAGVRRADRQRAQQPPD